MEHFLFYADSADGKRILLKGDEARHAVKALRVSVGSTIAAADGRGIIYHAVVSKLAGDRCEADIKRVIKRDRILPSLSFYIGLPDRDAFEAVVRTLPPLGVSDIIPVECDFCQNRWWHSKWGKLSQRFRKIMISSIKQAYYPYLPALSRPVPFHKALEGCDPDKVVALQDGAECREFAGNIDKNMKLSCFIGPPGGFSEKEKKMLEEAGAYTVRISPNRLRTELAAVVLASKLIS